MTRDELLVAADYHQERGEMEAALGCLLWLVDTVTVGGIEFAAWGHSAPGYLFMARWTYGVSRWYYWEGAWEEDVPASIHETVGPALEAALRLALAPRE